MRQQGSQAARASTEQAAEQAAKEGSAVGLLRVVLKEYDHDNVHMLQLAAKPLLLQEIKVCDCVVKSNDVRQCKFITDLRKSIQKTFVIYPCGHTSCTSLHKFYANLPKWHVRRPCVDEFSGLSPDSCQLPQVSTPLEHLK